MAEQRTDSELVIRVRAGDKEAFGVLIERHSPMVRRLIAQMVRQSEIRSDLLQESMLQAYLSLKHLKDAARFKQWLYGITLNVCRSYIRARKSDDLSLEAITGGMQKDLAAFLDTFHAVDPQYVVEARELHQVILQAVQSLSPKDRVATLLFYYDQLSLQEIAAVLGISVGAVKGRLFRAREQLKERLARVYEQYMPETSTTERAERKSPMQKMVIDSVRTNVAAASRVVVLRAETGKALLMIWIGVMEASVIAQALEGGTPPRPMTAHLLVNVLQASGMQLEEVRIESLKEEIFYAVVKIRNGEEIYELDARPSDALSLAVLLHCPIYAADEVIAKCGIELKEGESIEEWANGLGTVLIGKTLSTSEFAELMRQFRETTPEQREAIKERLRTIFYASTEQRTDQTSEG